MKKRISHFTTNHIQINKITRPVPAKPNTIIEHKTTIKRKRSSEKIRNSLARTLVLALTCVGVGRVSFDNINQKAHKKAKQSTSKIGLQRQAVTKESNYAATPAGQYSTLIES